MALDSQGTLPGLHIPISEQLELMPITVFRTVEGEYGVTKEVIDTTKTAASKVFLGDQYDWDRLSAIYEEGHLIQTEAIKRVAKLLG